MATFNSLNPSWEEFSVLATSSDTEFQEPNLYRTPSGKLVAFIRTLHHSKNSSSEHRHPLYTCESYDNGETWVNLTKRPIYSPSPFHALQLNSGEVMLTYGYRMQPFGIRAMLLNSECTNWDEVEEVCLREDGLGGDIGYTHAVQLDNGQILITYYYYDEEHPLRYIAGTLCELVK